MNKIIRYLLIFLFLSCEDVINLDTERNADNIVVEGWVTDKDGPQVIEISRANKFTSTKTNQTIENAKVTVINTEGIHYEYKHVKGGTYISDSSFTGIYEMYYYIQIVLGNGDTIFSNSEKLIEVHDIKRLEFNSFVDEDPSDPKLEIEIYYPVAFAVDPAEEMNFYKWNLYKNNLLFSASSEIFLFEDRFINGNSYKNEFTNYHYLLDDSIAIEVQSLSDEAFKYFSLFKSQTSFLQSRTGSNPSAIPSNLYNQTKPQEKVLGYFGATSLKRKEQLVR